MQTGSGSRGQARRLPIFENHTYRKSLCVASNMPLDVSLEIPSSECCSLYHDDPSLKKTEIQREGKTKRVGFVTMEQALSLPHQKL